MHASAQDRTEPCARKAHVMTATLQKQAYARNPLKTSPVSNVRN
jgi:hypothetical protein